MAKKIIKYSLIFVILLPFALLLLLALNSSWQFPDVFGSGFDGSLLQLITSDEILQSGKLTFGIAITVSLLSTVFGFVTSRAIYRSRFQYLLLMSSYLPFVISPVVYAIVLSYFFLVGGLSGTLLGVTVGHLLIAFPFATILSFSFWNEHTENLIEVSQSLGVGQKQIWIQILFPMAKPQLLVVFFQVFLVSWFEYGLTQYIGVGSVKVLTISVFNFVQEADLTLAATASLLLVVPPVVLLWLNKKYIYPKILSPDA